MKKLILTTLLGVGYMVVMQSCQKEVIQSEIIKELTIDTTISVNSTFNLDLSGVYDPSKVVNIIQQAQHFTVSMIDTVEDTNYPYYTYSSSLQRSGTDKVVLSVSNRTDGKTAVRNDSTIIYINLTIK